MLAVHGAFSDRASALLTIQTLMSDLTSLHARTEKLEAASSKIFGGDRARIRKVEELKETIRVNEDAKSCALREYERIKVMNYLFVRISQLWSSYLQQNWLHVLLLSFCIACLIF